MTNNGQFGLISKRILRELEAMTEAIRSGFLGIQENIEAKSKNQKTEKENQGGDVRIPPTHIVVESFPAIPNDESTYKTQQHRRERIKFYVGWLTLLFVATYTVVTLLQYRITRQSLLDNRQSIELLEKQVKASIGAVVQRQFIIGWPSNQTYLSVFLSNRGKTVATNVRGDLIVEKGKLQGNRFSGSFLKAWKLSVPEIYPEPEMPPTTGVYLDISKDALTEYNGIHGILRVTGEISYFNGFEVQHRSICQYVMGPTVFTNKAGKTQAGVGEGAVECDQIESKLTYIKSQTDQYYK